MKWIPPPATTKWRLAFRAYELALPHASPCPEAVDLAQEPEHIKKLYGLDQKRTADFGTRCLLARRMVERGVRFVQLYSGGGPVSIQWDAHSNLKENHEKMCGLVDQPIAALLKDLKQRGLLDSTLVIWGVNLAGFPIPKAATAGTIIPTATPCGWPAVASKADK